MHSAVYATVEQNDQCYKDRYERYLSARISNLPCVMFADLLHKVL
jgi:hypothetical protein